MSIIETEIWKPKPGKPGTVEFDGQRPAQECLGNNSKSHNREERD